MGPVCPVMMARVYVCVDWIEVSVKQEMISMKTSDGK